MQLCIQVMIHSFGFPGPPVIDQVNDAAGLLVNSQLAEGEKNYDSKKIGFLKHTCASYF